MRITGIILCGWIHHKNLIGLKLVCEKFNIPLLIINNINDKQIYNDNIYNIVFITDKISSPIPNKFVILGPHISVFPPSSVINMSYTDKDKIVLNLLCDWNVKVWTDFGTTIPLVTLPFAVDINKFLPSSEENKQDIFIYYKQRDPQLFQTVLSMVKSKVKNNIHTIAYGFYNEDSYINILKKCRFGIWVGRHESQGFALQEALSSNIPLIVMDVKTMKEEYNNGFIYAHINKNLNATAIPWWSEKCGIVIYNVNELSLAIDTLENNISTYEPRRYIIDNLSPEKTFDNLTALVAKY